MTLRKDPVGAYLAYEARMQRLPLFRLVAEHLGARSALYPGSWIHLAPSLVVPEVVYVDADRRCPAFFADPAVRAHVAAHQAYAEPAVFRFHGQDYTRPLPEPDGSFELLISQYAGCISQPCRRYLRVGGHLLVNDSHGDAGVAALDPSYALVGAVEEGPAGPVLRLTGLDGLFVPRREGGPATIADRQAHGKSLRYVQTADHYLFRRVD